MQKLSFSRNDDSYCNHSIVHSSFVTLLEFLTSVQYLKKCWCSMPFYLKINITRLVWCFWEERERKSAAGASESTPGNCFKYSETEYLSIFLLTTLNYTINNVGVFFGILFSPNKQLLCHIHIQHLWSDLRDFNGRSTTFINTLLILLVCVRILYVPFIRCFLEIYCMFLKKKHMPKCI